MIKKELLEILVCPKCRSSLDYCEEPESLICSECCLRFPIREDIPIMLLDEAEDISETKSEKDLWNYHDIVATSRSSWNYCPRQSLRYLPSYQPGLNPQERIWRQVRYEATTNRWFETLDFVWDTVQRTTRTWTPNKVRRLCQIT